MNITPDLINSLAPNQIFVFGSNLSGFHLGGAAKTALQWGAKWGEPVGLHGQTYAIPTVGHEAKGTLSAEEIKPYVDQFIKDAKKHSDKEFLVTEIGCGIAGLQPKEVGPLFRDALPMTNISLPQRFIDSLR